MRCNAASLGALVQVLGLSLGAVSGSGLVVFSGLIAGLAAGAVAVDSGPQSGLAVSTMGLAGFAVSVGFFFVVDGAVPAFDPVTVAAVTLTALAGGALGGTVSDHLSGATDHPEDADVDGI